MLIKKIGDYHMALTMSLKKRNDINCSDVSIGLIVQYRYQPSGSCECPVLQTHEHENAPISGPAPIIKKLANEYGKNYIGCGRIESVLDVPEKTNPDRVFHWYKPPITDYESIEINSAGDQFGKYRIVGGAYEDELQQNLIMYTQNSFSNFNQINLNSNFQVQQLNEPILFSNKIGCIFVMNDAPDEWINIWGASYYVRTIFRIFLTQATSAGYNPTRCSVNTLPSTMAIKISTDAAQYSQLDVRSVTTVQRTQYSNYKYSVFEFDGSDIWFASTNEQIKQGIYLPMLDCESCYPDPPHFKIEFIFDYTVNNPLDPNDNGIRTCRLSDTYRFPCLCGYPLDEDPEMFKEKCLYGITDASKGYVIQV